LVAHFLGVEGVAGSNPVGPIYFYNSDFGLLFAGTRRKTASMTNGDASKRKITFLNIMGWLFATLSVFILVVYLDKGQMRNYVMTVWFFCISAPPCVERMAYRTGKAWLTERKGLLLRFVIGLVIVVYCLI
jgi:hypothetical protein